MELGENRLPVRNGDLCKFALKLAGSEPEMCFYEEQDVLGKQIKVSVLLELCHK